MSQKTPLKITAKQISYLTGFSVATARREINFIKQELREANKRVPRTITIAMYSDWSGISEEKIEQFLSIK